MHCSFLGVADGTDNTLNRILGERLGALGEIMMTLLRAISGAFGRMFGPRDNFKALLMADLGIKR